MHALFIDDLSEAEAINLKKQLMDDPTQRPYPLNYHERTKHIHSVIFYNIALSIQTCHMLMAEPSTYDMFALLKKNGYVDG